MVCLQPELLLCPSIDVVCQILLQQVCLLASLACLLMAPDVPMASSALPQLSPLGSHAAPAWSASPGQLSGGSLNELCRQWGWPLSRI
eukprot:CAMPEP_0175809988 /NCGR_PEP_ID=MMETSP0107_2-20121207/3085_1 /TAXON_ID=195067 ORGANISM="Goniomonas pacifica, Strain CCMP1869" /NCGR_SAMPLE_ID=MMETSP0107_2 /ASSEMBLY_ACC=CAM_ASM_000203 /LENGTH=87 /DNA_ID=CAMNT_0017121717 /DNA_START=650 /DNA_END=913 /DNA_ORIENTATION=+